MCRMIGIAFRREYPMETLLDLSDVAKNGLVPGEPIPGHRDGWGIVSFRHGTPLYVGRSSRPIFNDESFDSARRDVLKIDTPNILIAHARALSTGAATIPNTHPFVMDGIVLCHNGTVKNIRFKPRYCLPSSLTESRRVAIWRTPSRISSLRMFAHMSSRPLSCSYPTARDSLHIANSIQVSRQSTTTSGWRCAMTGSPSSRRLGWDTRARCRRSRTENS